MKPHTTEDLEELNGHVVGLLKRLRMPIGEQYRMSFDTVCVSPGWFQIQNLSFSPLRPSETMGTKAQTIAQGNHRLANYIEAYQKLSDMPGKQLVGVALEHLGGNQLEQLLIEELCSRAYPGWEKE